MISCAGLLRSAVRGCSPVPGAGLPVILGVTSLVGVRVSGRFIKSSTSESGLERLLTSAAVVPFM